VSRTTKPNTMSLTLSNNGATAGIGEDCYEVFSLKGKSVMKVDFGRLYTRFGPFANLLLTLRVPPGVDAFKHVMKRLFYSPDCLSAMTHNLFGDVPETAIDLMTPKIVAPGNIPGGQDPNDKSVCTFMLALAVDTDVDDTFLHAILTLASRLHDGVIRKDGNNATGGGPCSLHVESTTESYGWLKKEEDAHDLVIEEYLGTFPDEKHFGDKVVQQALDVYAKMGDMHGEDPDKEDCFVNEFLLRDVMDRIDVGHDALNGYIVSITTSGQAVTDVTSDPLLFEIVNAGCPGSLRMADRDLLQKRDDEVTKLKAEFTESMRKYYAELDIV